MTTNIQSVHFNADKKLLSFIEDKVSKLNTFYEGIMSSDITLRLDKSATTDNKVAEIKVLAKGQELFAKRQCTSFEEAIDTALDALKAQIKKHKERLTDRKASTSIEEM